MRCVFWAAVLAWAGLVLSCENPVPGPGATPGGSLAAPWGLLARPQGDGWFIWTGAQWKGDGWVAVGRAAAGAYTLGPGASLVMPGTNGGPVLALWDREGGYQGAWAVPGTAAQPSAELRGVRVNGTAVAAWGAFWGNTSFDPGIGTPLAAWPSSERPFLMGFDKTQPVWVLTPNDGSDSPGWSEAAAWGPGTWGLAGWTTTGGPVGFGSLTLPSTPGRAWVMSLGADGRPLSLWTPASVTGGTAIPLGAGSDGTHLWVALSLDPGASADWGGFTTPAAPTCRLVVLQFSRSATVSGAWTLVEGGPTAWFDRLFVRTAGPDLVVGAYAGAPEVQLTGGSRLAPAGSPADLRGFPFVVRWSPAGGWKAHWFPLVASPNGVTLDGLEVGPDGRVWAALTSPAGDLEVGGTAPIWHLTAENTAVTLALGPNLVPQNAWAAVPPGTNDATWFGGLAPGPGGTLAVGTLRGTGAALGPYSFSVPGSTKLTGWMGVLP